MLGNNNLRRQACPVEEGDMVLIPNGDSHALVDSLQSEIISADELLSNVPKTRSNEILFGGEGAHPSSLTCRRFEDARDTSRLFHLLFQ